MKRIHGLFGASAFLLASCAGGSDNGSVSASPETAGERPAAVAVASHKPTEEGFKHQLGDCFDNTVYDLTAHAYSVPANLVPSVVRPDEYALHPSGNIGPILSFGFNPETGSFFPTSDVTAGKLALRECVIPQN